MVHMPYLGKGGTSLGINFGTAAVVLYAKRIENYSAQYEYTVYYETDSEGEYHESEYDSENLMYGLLRSILEENDLAEYGIVFEEPLKELLSRRQIACLTDDERRYVLNDLTHVDFIIYNKTSKSPVLAVEVDGYRYHRPGSRQAMRDRMKDAILEKSGVKLLRFSTTGSGEKGKILAALGCI